MLGDCTYSTQLLVEIVSNAVDEYRLGHGNVINIHIDNKDGATKVSVQDYGQGFIPNSFREDGKTILEAAFSVLNTSGKYRADGTYEGTSLGSFGIGAKLTNFLANEMEVYTVRDGVYEMVNFKEGVFENREVGKTSQPSGTIVKWTPSKEFFTHTSIEINKTKALLETIACLCPGLEINCTIDGEKFTYFSKNGISDLIDKNIKNKEILKNRFKVNYNGGKEKMDLVMTYTSDYSCTIIPYVNTGLTEKGPHITQVKSVLTREFNKFFRDKKWLKDKDENLSGDDIQEGAFIIFNLTAPNVAYNAQVKSTITKIEMGNFAQVLAQNLQQWFSLNEKEVKIIFDKAISAQKAREAAKKARDKVREGKKEKNKVLNLPTKLVDCWNKKRLDCELLIAEGDSAAAGLIGARDSEYQGIFPIRGKIINLFKNSDEKVFANQEVNNIIKALGLDFNPKTKKLTYNLDDLRYGKILLCCDGDADGKAIKNLLLTCLWSLCPELITNGHVYAAVPPLFRITTSKNEYIYLADEKALEEYKQQHQGEKYMVNRNKRIRRTRQRRT